MHRHLTVIGLDPKPQGGTTRANEVSNALAHSPSAGGIGA